ncbi:hypothetical protein JKA74_17585 [Marivirga sp. S37H4]|uniref:Uncharacterized protein n=1 Tax=Marivirga aurantiaca TaxID=2802615 RepID=A0A935CAY3_9BACT|nr:hypothetical protein [Marivirga aurantiaca]MBK6266860.1 hypothetical protein [Marivirga aurantiaca]
MSKIVHIENKDPFLLNDWELARSLYSCKSGGCTNCLSKFQTKDSLILPLSELFNKKVKVDSAGLYKSISSWRKPVLFYHQGKRITRKVLIKFTGSDNFEPSILALLPFLKERKVPANVISPYALTKANRSKEHDLVELTKQYFEPLGFIKLNLHTVADFHEFATTDEVGLLMLPLKDLPDYIQYASRLSNYNMLLPAIFQP